ncbi:hypothetical protein OAS39_11960 [Pirellulales bacterium]|nr:hypothetical protein [Pirellulales bacterium]
MATDVATARPDYRLGRTDRRDSWWIGPLATALGLGVFVVYATLRAIWNEQYVVERAGAGELLSPFYSPLVRPDWLPLWFSPALLILWAPGGFRLTCYYYRKAYYRAYFLDPPACGVGEPRNQYRGETRLLLFQNLHRYFLYLAIIFLFLLAYDVVKSCIFAGEDGRAAFGVSIGTLVLAANTTLLTMYTFSCHSLRHLVGGNVDCFSCAAGGQARYRLWRGASILNKKHMLWAWLSLFMVGFADFYVWMVASGRISDVRIF